MLSERLCSLVMLKVILIDEFVGMNLKLLFVIGLFDRCIWMLLNLIDCFVVELDICLSCSNEDYEIIYY